MATKLFNGYKITLGSETLLSFCARVRAALDPVYYDNYGRLLVEMATTIADGRARGEATTDDTSPVVQSPLMVAMSALDNIKRTVDTKHTRVPGADFACDITFLEDPQDHALYALLFSERSQYRDVWDALDEVTPFPYWNNTDRPEGLSEEAWDLRCTTWERVLPYSDSVPAQRGLTWSLLSAIHHAASHFVFHEENVTPYIPTTHERARVIAKRLANAYMDSIRTESLVDPADGHSAANAMRVLTAERPARDAAIERFTAEVEPTLAPISYATLTGHQSL